MILSVGDRHAVRHEVDGLQRRGGDGHDPAGRRGRLEPTVAAEVTEVTEVTEAAEFAEPAVEGPHILASGSDRPGRSRPAPRETRIRKVRHRTRIRHDAGGRSSHIGYCCGGSSSGTEGDQGCDCGYGDRRAECELAHCSHLHFLSVPHRLVRCR